MEGVSSASVKPTQIFEDNAEEGEGGRKRLLRISLLCVGSVAAVEWAPSPRAEMLA